MFYDLNVPWPADVFAASAARNASQEYASYINQLSQYTSGQHASPNAAPAGKKKKGKKPLVDPAANASAAGQTDAPPTRPPALTPFDAFAGLGPSSKARIEAITLDLHELGYRHIAYNHTIRSRFNPSVHQNPFFDPRTKLTQPPIPTWDPRTQVSYRRQFPGAALDTNTSIEQLSRLTLILDAESFGKAGHGLGSSSTTALLTYDILAVCPTTEAAFALTCTSLTELKPNSIDVISLDFAAAPRLPFILRRSSISAAIQNGAVFEVCYGSLVGVEDTYALLRAGANETQQLLSLSSEGRSKARRNLIGGVKDLLRITKGKNVIFSSGVADLLGLRGPADIINLASIFGMQASDAKKTLSSTARSLFQRARTRKTWRGIVGAPRLRLLPIRPMLSIPNPVDDMVGISGAPDQDVSMTNVEESGPVSSVPEQPQEEDQAAMPSKRPREPSPVPGFTVGQSDAKPASKKPKKHKAQV